MVKNVIILITAMLVMLFFAGCGVSQAKATKIVKASLQKTFISDPQYTEFDLNLKDLQMVKIGNNSYKGTALVDYAGRSYEVPLIITVDGSKVEWDLEPGAFAFLKG